MRLLLWFCIAAVFESSPRSDYANRSWARLAFDENGALRDWTHRSFFHGGEVRPEPCQAGHECLVL